MRYILFFILILSLSVQGQAPTGSMNEPGRKYFPNGTVLVRLTTAEMLAISGPNEGMEIYNKDSLAPCWYNGTNWDCAAAGGSVGPTGATGVTGATGATGTFSGSAWLTGSNSGIDSSANAVGTSDAKGLKFVTNGLMVGGYSSNGVAYLGDSITRLSVTKVSSGVYPTTSYSNLGGSGDRTGLITTTAHCGVSGGCSIASPANRMVNGDYSSTNWYLTSSPLADISTAYIVLQVYTVA